MRARAIALGAVSSVAVLAVGWQLSAGPEASTTTGRTATSAGGATGTEDTTGSGTGAGSGSGSASGSGSGSGTASGSDGTFTGDAVQTRYGPVQVQVTISGGTITDVQAVQLTDHDGRSVAISQQAAPVLRQEALQAQSAAIQAVTGATYTSEGYTTSLQSALDRAGR